MARKRSITSIETEITKVKAELFKLQEKQDKLSAQLVGLQKQKREYEANEIMDAYLKSGKSYQELMKADRLGLLEPLFNEVLIPEAVYSELITDYIAHLRCKKQLP